MKKNILVVIDLQPFFLPKSAPVLDRVIEQIEEVIDQRNWKVLLVEYTSKFHDCGRTHDKIVKACKDKEIRIHKTTDGGSDNIFAGLMLKDIEPKAFKVCGVNTPYCVASTAFGLALLYPKAKIELIKSACDHYCCCERVGEYQNKLEIKDLEKAAYSYPNMRVA